MEGIGFTLTWSPGEPTVGCTDGTSVKLDLDDVPLKTVKLWTEQTCEKYHLGGFLILRSSHHCYHVLFDRPVTWLENISIIAWTCLMSKHQGLTKWLLLQCIKGQSTLRILRKKEKSPPRIVFKHGTQHREIKNFQHFRAFLKRCSKRNIDKTNEKGGEYA